MGERGEREEEREREGGEKHLQQREELSAGQKLEDHVEALRVLVRGDEARAEGVVAPAVQGGRVEGEGARYREESSEEGGRVHRQERRPQEGGGRGGRGGAGRRVQKG